MSDTQTCLICAAIWGASGHGFMCFFWSVIGLVLMAWSIHRQAVTERKRG